LLSDDSLVSKSIYHSRFDNIDYIKGSNDVMNISVSDINVLGKVLSHIASDYDVCLIDCHPDASVISENALAIADLVLIPINLDGFSRDNLNLVI
jgi:chromosome partitioning protein